MICMKWPVCQRSCRPTRRCDGRLPSPIDAARFRPRPLSRLVLRPTSNTTPSLPLLRGTSSGRLPRRLHVLEHTIFSGLSLLSPDSWARGRGGRQIDTRQGLVVRELVEPTRHMAPCFVCRRRRRGPVFRDLDDMTMPKPNAGLGRVGLGDQTYYSSLLACGKRGENEP